jgi:NAD(P)H dehydrogenase (quinone)
MGSTSAEFKKFMEVSSKQWMQQTWKNKIAAGFTNSGSMNGDKLNTLIDLAIFAAQHSMIWVDLDILPVSSSTQDGFKEPNRLGSFLGAMAQSNSDQGPDVTPPTTDLKTAELLGHRVSEITNQFLHGRIG